MMSSVERFKKNKVRIAVIGAGVSGLCAARHITKPGSHMTCVVYEQTDKIGGTWVYTDKINVDKFGLPIHSSMFKNLRTTLSRQLIEFPDFPMKIEECYPTGEDIYNYLIAYAKNYNILPYIQFNSHVTRVAPFGAGWEISVCDLETKKQKGEHFDSVIVCNGHYSVPDIPYIKGLDLFQGKIMHSHHYRKPDEMLGKNIVIIGSGPSAGDLVLDILGIAKKIYFVHNLTKWKNCKFSPEVEQVPQVIEITENGVIFEDNNSAQVDVILFCTGYNYNFPFLTPECGVEIEGGRYVKPLYKHLIHVYNPTICFPGIPYFVINFLTIDIQIQFFLKILSGDVQLPSTHEMLQDIEENVKRCEKQGKTFKYYHRVGNEQNEQYLQTLCKIAKLPKLPSVLFKMFNATVDYRENTGVFYRDLELYKIDDTNFKKILRK